MVPVSVYVAIGCGVVWLGAALWTRWRPSRTLPIDYAGPVPEVLRVLLRRRNHRGDQALLNAAILELAEAGVLRVEPADSQGPAMVTPQVLLHASQLPDYQASVVDRLLHRRGVGRMPVPLTALHPNEDPTATKWHREFVRQVQQAAADRGLLQRPVGASRFMAMLLTGLLVSVLGADALSRYWHGKPGLTTLQFIFFAVVMFAVLAWASRVRPTPAGRALRAAELPSPVAPAPASSYPVPAQPRPDSTLVMQPVPDGSAPQPAPGVPDIRILPNQLQPLPNSQVWSDYGGAWHPLEINTKEAYAIRPGAPAVLVPIFFAILSLVGAAVSKHNGDPTGTVSFVFFAALPVILIGILAAGMLRRRHLPKRAVIRGQVAKLWEDRRRSGESEKREFFCALDVGNGPESVRLRLGAGGFRKLRVGQEVEVLVNPRRKSIKDLHYLDPE
jgi:hypothetical protein